MNGWEVDKRWSDRFLPEIKQILGLYLIGEPAPEEDQERNTDLVVLKMEAVRIACRVRKAEYFDRYPNEFTIRAGRPSGVKTELTKVVEGWGDYFFYGFATADESSLRSWFLGRLNVFRLWYNGELIRGRRPGQRQKNRDGSSDFLAFDRSNLPRNFTVAEWRESRKAA